MSDVIDLLLRRRSVPAFALGEPGPSAGEIETLLTAASRVPDHGKLAPWRFILIEGSARGRLASHLSEYALADDPDADRPRLAEDLKKFDAPLTIVVVSRAGPHVKIPEWEQVLSVGAATMNLVVAAHALGFAANWLTGWPAYDRRVAELLGLAAAEKIAGFVHIGSTEMAPSDRPRPPLDEIATRWQGA
jgi:nitroreductase